MVSQVTGLLDSQRHTMNHERIQKGRKQQAAPQWKGTPEQSAAAAPPPRPRKTPSNDALARIARSTATQFKYISYVIAYSANQPGDEEAKKGGIRESARRRSGKAGVPTSRHRQQRKKGAVGPTAKMAKKPDPRQGHYFDEPLLEPSGDRHEQNVAGRPENQGVYRILPKSERMADKFVGQKDKVFEYPLNEDGYLRDEYRIALRDRLMAGGYRWDVKCIEGRYWPSLCGQRRNGGIKKIDNTKFLLAAVELHMAMMDDEKMLKSKEQVKKDAEKKTKEEKDEERWREVADSMSPRIPTGITFVKHIVGDQQKKWSLGQFLYAFDTKLKEMELDKKPSALWDKKEG